MLHPTVGYVVAGGTTMAVVFYVSTTLIAAIYVSAPFKTPLSRGVYWTYQIAIYWMRKLLSSVLEEGWFPMVPEARFSFRFVTSATARFLVFLIILPARLPFFALIKAVSWLDAHGCLETNETWLLR